MPTPACLTRIPERLHAAGHEAQLAEHHCARLNGELLQRIVQRSSFYQLVRMQRRESLGAQSLVLRTLGARIGGRNDTAKVADRLRRTAEWQRSVWSASVQGMQRERVRIEHQAGRGAIAMGLCERAAGIALTEQLAAAGKCNF